MSDSEQGLVGSSFDDFLKEQGTYEETTSQAIKRVLAFQLAPASVGTVIGYPDSGVCSGWEPPIFPPVKQ